MSTLPKPRLLPDHLAALVGSRLCHDLIGPVGAIGNGVELVSLDPRPRPGELALLSDSVAAASARLRFYRIAFGVAGRDQMTGRAEVVPLLADLYRAGRLSVDWTSPPDLPRAEVKLAFLLMLCAEHALPTGGSLSVLRDQTGWRIRASSPRLRHDAALWALLETSALPPALDPSQVQFALAAGLLADLDSPATVAVDLAALTVSF